MIRSVLGYLRRHHIGLLALALALGGTAYAANSIRSRDVVDGSLKSKDFKNGTIRGRDVQANALNSSHIDEGTLNPSVSSATVLATSEGTLLQYEDGFESVRLLGPGLYELTVSADTRTGCNFATTFIAGNVDKSTPQATSIAVTGVTDETMGVQIRGADGELVGLGDGSGAAGFSLLSTC